uniref:Putative tumor necrosis factor triatoma dimidiata n=1 Tax=Rhodnius prolixus TaxID=13249 RepID=A0A4P6D6Y5_RHOPR
MEEKHSKQPLLYLFVASTASVCLAVTIAYLEIRRDAEVEQLRSEVAILLKYVDSLKAKLNRTESFAKKFDEVMKKLSKSPPTAAGGTYDEEDEYYDDTYDYDYEDPKAPAVNSSSREKRSVDEHGGRVLNILHMRTHPIYQQAAENHKVLAKIVISGNEQDQQTPPTYVKLEPKEEEVHHGSNGHGHHHRKTDECEHVPVLAHFGADSGGAASIGLPHYEANHRMYHPEGVFRNWTPAAWVPHGRDGQIVLEEENIIVKQPGIYYLYAQIFYANSHDRSGFRVFVNHRPVFQCTTTTRNCHGSNHMKWNSCFTGGLVKLQEYDNITLREIEGDRYTVFEKTKSFFGLFRVAVRP